MVDPEDFQLMTPEEITARIHALGKHGDDAASRWALKLLHSQQQSDSGLPPPLTENEYIERLARVMKPAGRELCQIAYRKAFPYGPKLNLGVVQAGVRAQHLPEDAKERIKKVHNLKSLYRLYPQVKKHGVPMGYPRSKGIEVIQSFVRSLATQIEVDRMNDSLKEEANGTQGSEQADPVGQQG